MILSLSRRVQRLAQKQLVQLSFTNAMGFGFITGQTIYLIALMYGASDTQMGLLYAAPFVTALAALFVPMLLNGQETTSIWARSWGLRTLLCLGYFALPYLDFAKGRIWIFILLYYLFMTTRSFGMASYFTVVKALATPRENASLMARTLLCGQFGVLLAQAIAFAVLTFHVGGSEEKGLYLLLAIGIFFNAVTAGLIGRLPKTGYLEEGSMGSLSRVAGQILHRREYHEVALVTAFQAAMSVFAGYLISYLRQVAGYSSGMIFLFTVTGLLGAIFISNMQRMIGSHIRERVMLLASHSALAVLSLVWALIGFVPGAGTNSWVVCVLYALTVVGLTASATVALQLRTGRLPSRHSVEHSIVYDMAQVVGAFAAIACVYFASGTSFGTDLGLHSYSPTFLLWTVTCLAVCALAFRMSTSGNSGLKQEFSALLPSSIFTIIRARRLDQDDNVVRRHLALEGLLQNPNQVSRELILEHLRSPDPGTRGSCIRVLMGYPVEGALPALLAEAASPFSPLRTQAVTAVGFFGMPAALPVLRCLWEGAPADVRAALVKTLLRLGEDLPDSRILEVWKSCPRASRSDILIGLAVTRRVSLLLQLLAEELLDRPDPYWTQALFGIAAASANLRESMFEVFSEEARNPGKGLDYIAVNVEAAWPPELSIDRCRDCLRQENYAALTELLRRSCDQAWVVAYDRSSALGVLFLLLLHRGGSLSPGPSA